MKEIRYKTHIFYYIEPWNGLFYKSRLYEVYSEQNFKQITNTGFNEFYEKHCINSTKSHYSIEQYLMEYAELHIVSKSTCKELINKLAINTKYMSYKHVLEHLIEKGFCKPKLETYEINCNKKAIRLINEFLVKQLETKNTYLVAIPKFKSLDYISKIKETDNNAQYKLN